MKNNLKIVVATIVIAAFFGMIIFSSVATAQNKIETNSTTAIPLVSAPQSIFDKFHLLGKGIAVSTTNSTDIHFMTIGIAEVNLTSLIQKLSQYITLPPGIPSSVEIGVFHFDSASYQLKNIALTNDTATADIYLNSTNVGSLNLEWTTRAGRVLWVGSITLNGNSYNAYILEGATPQSTAMNENQIQNGCERDPGQCSQVANSTHAAAIYCTNNPNDTRCTGLKEAYCQTNLDDSNCRPLLFNQCMSTPNSTVCTSACKDHPELCGGVHKPTRIPIMQIHMPSIETNENSSESGMMTNVNVNEGIGVNANGG